MSKGTIQQVSEAMRNRKGTSEQKATEAETELVLSLRNDKTNADEAVLWTRGILYVLTAFVVYLGFNYYESTFSEMFPYPVAVAFAIALPVVVEIGKIRLASKALRSFWFGWINDGWYATAYWLFVTILSVGAYVWSYSISTGGIKEVATQNATIKNKQDSLQTVIAMACSNVDARLSQINDSDLQAAKMTTKKGKVAWSGQSIMMNNAASKTALQNERNAIIEQVKADYLANGTETKLKVSKWSSFIEKFGGWGEYGTFLCLLIISFFEKRLYLANMGPVSAQSPTPPAQNQTAQTAQASNAPQNGQSVHPFGINTAPAPSAHTPIGFRWPGYGQTTPPTTVAQYTEPVAQSPQQEKTVLGCDQILMQLRAKLQSDIPNLQNRNGSQQTISARINLAFDRCFEAIESQDFRPSRETGAKVYHYLVETAIPALNGVGWPYERDVFFLKRLLEVIPKSFSEAQA